MERRQAHLQRRKAIKQPSSRGLCLKVTLGGQIDGISDGAKRVGLYPPGRRDSLPHTADISSEKQDLFITAVHHLLNALSIDGLALGLTLGLRVCTEEHGLHSVCSAVPCVL